MKKRAFLLPVATTIAALTTATPGEAKTVVPTSQVQASSEALPVPGRLPGNLVIDRAETQIAQYGHSSHGSHGSHGSHASHTSSR
jgi:hypothetical protein